MGCSAALMSPGAGLAADASSLTSLRRTPHRPAHEALWVFDHAEAPPCAPRVSGGRRSEVKEEGRAQPGPGDMSAVGRPTPLAVGRTGFRAGWSVPGTLEQPT
jgi:hypothetical protein